jgi:hypothetical protein
MVRNELTWKSQSPSAHAQQLVRSLSESQSIVSTRLTLSQRPEKRFARRRADHCLRRAEALNLGNDARRLRGPRIGKLLRTAENRFHLMEEPRAGGRLTRG